MRRTKMMIVATLVTLAASVGGTSIAAEAGKAPVQLRSDNWCC